MSLQEPLLEASSTCYNAQKTRMALNPDWEKIGLSKKEKLIFQTVRPEVPPEEGHPGKIEREKPIQHFLTGSSYQGSWNAIGFSGYGIYYFPHGAIYDGFFKNGQFHGKGNITYPVGHRLQCVHKNGKLINHLLIFNDRLEAHHPNNYCQMPDRRFQVEFNTTLRGAGKEFLTNRQPTIEIPEHCYDTIDGFYVPSVKCIYYYDEESMKIGETPHHRRITDTLKRTVTVEESKFIEENYRKSSIRHVGYRPDLYEFLMTGRRAEVEEAMPCYGLREKSRRFSRSLASDESSSEINVKLEFEQLKTSYYNLIE